VVRCLCGYMGGWVGGLVEGWVDGVGGWAGRRWGVYVYGGYLIDGCVVRCCVCGCVCLWVENTHSGVVVKFLF
jgi:hypothetical protein